MKECDGGRCGCCADAAEQPEIIIAEVLILDLNTCIVLAVENLSRAANIKRAASRSALRHESL